MSNANQLIERKEAELNKIQQEKELLEEEKIEIEKQKEELEVKLQAKLEKEEAEKSQVRVASVTNEPVGTGDCYTAMKKVFPESQWSNASLVIRKESGGRPNAVSRTDDHGCFQLHKGYASWGRAVYNADFNAQKAYRMYKSRGWRPWYAVQGILW